jgi:hypothetical protein
MRQVLWALVLAVPLSALAQGNQVDWQRQVLRVTGEGPPDVRASNPAQARLGAERAAKADALEELLELVKGVPLRSGRTVGDELAQEETRKKVEAALGGFQVVHKRYYSDSGVRMDVEVPLAGVTAVLVPAAPRAAEDGGSPRGTGKPASKTHYTGVVVDARELSMTPVLAPRLLDEKGQPLHGAETLSDEARRTTGVAGFFGSLEAAKASERVGEKPLVLKATQVQGSDLVLEAEAVKALAGMDPEVLAAGRVAILVR